MCLGKQIFTWRLPGRSLTGVTVLQAFLSNQFHRNCQQPLAANEGIILFPEQLVGGSQACLLA